MKLQPYAKLIDAFLAGEMAAEDFEHRFLEEFKAEKRILSSAAFEALDELFGYVDAFCANKELRAQLKHAVDEKQLVHAAERVRRKLLQLPQEGIASVPPGV